MRTPKDSKSQVRGKSPAGGNAYARIQQERTARGLGEVSSPPAPAGAAKAAAGKTAKAKPKGA